MLSVTIAQLCSTLHCSVKIAIDKTETIKCGSVPIKLYLWTQKFEFHIIFDCHKNTVLLLIFLPPVHLKL